MSIAIILLIWIGCIAIPLALLFGAVMRERNRRG